MRISDWSSDVCSSDLLSEPEELQSPADHFRRVRRTVAFGDRILPAVQKLQPRRLPLAPQAPQTSCVAKRRLTRHSSLEKVSDSAKREHGCVSQESATRRSAARRVVFECVSTCQSRRARY